MKNWQAKTNELIMPVHDRMPVILPKDGESLCVPPQSEMDFRAV